MSSMVKLRWIFGVAVMWHMTVGVDCVALVGGVGGGWRGDRRGVGIGRAAAVPGVGDRCCVVLRLAMATAPAMVLAMMRPSRVWA